jgi:hypothetical protein
MSRLLPLLAVTLSCAVPAGADPLLTYTDGGYYLGQLTAGRRDGQGTYLYPDYGLYTGHWQAGARHGQGLFKWPDGKVYEGEWRQGRMHGTGSLTFPDGGIFRGQWVDDRMIEDPGTPPGPDPAARAERCRQAGIIQAALRDLALALEQQPSAAAPARATTTRTWALPDACP